LRAADLDAGVLRPLRRMVRTWSVGPGPAPVDRAAVAERLSRRNRHLRSWTASFSDHLRLAAAFERIHTVRVLADDGSRHDTGVHHRPAVVASWRSFGAPDRSADSGWGTTAAAPVPSSTWWSSRRAADGNVFARTCSSMPRPRDAAWQQLRGRALRPWVSWNPDRQHELEMLRAHDGDELDDAVELLVTHNKVAHVYELLKGYGTEPQVRVDGRGRLRRTPSLAEKHRRESAVDLQTGEHSAGERHARLVFAADPGRHGR
jgi:hypothetical protein